MSDSGEALSGDQRAFAADAKALLPIILVGRATAISVCSFAILLQKVLHSEVASVAAHLKRPSVVRLTVVIIATTCAPTRSDLMLRWLACAA